MHFFLLLIEIINLNQSDYIEMNNQTKKLNLKTTTVMNTKQREREA